MSDLSATNCGCNNNRSNDCGCGGVFGGDSCTWIIILLLLFSCGGCGNGLLSNSNGCGCGCGNDSNGCGCLILILLLFCCGNGFGCC